MHLKTTNQVNEKGSIPKQNTVKLAVSDFFPSSRLAGNIVLMDSKN